jgi:Domain of unknown function (DUF4270)
VNKRHLALTLGTIITGIAFVFSACRKINESTELGSGLIPAVDNITTFDTTITIEAYNDTFGLAGDDSLRVIRTDEHFLGLINNDPIFGKTDARLFLELKPPSYPYSFLNKPDSLNIDSVVLILDYKDSYGDTMVPQTVNVYELDQSNNFTSDSAYLIRRNDLTYSNLLGSKTFLPATLDDSVFARMDTTRNQLRIRLDDSFGDRLLHYDSAGTYSSDSAFRSKFKGFALQSMNTGNAVMGFNLNGVNTKLAIYYRDDNGNSPKEDTAIAYFSFTSSSAEANYVQRFNYAGTPVAAAVGGALPDPLVYIQNSPGTFAILKIPGLASLSNRVVHRAELIVEEQYDASDAIFGTPSFLYLDAYDPTISVNPKFRTIPYDLSFDASGLPGLGNLGAIPISAIDGSGNAIKTWHFNISRYVQHVLTHTQSLYDLRLFAPYVVAEQYGIPPGADVKVRFTVNPTAVKGRVRLTGNTGINDTNPHRMRLRIVYSKL